MCSFGLGFHGERERERERKARGYLRVAMMQVSSVWTPTLSISTFIVAFSFAGEETKHFWPLLCSTTCI